MPRPSQHREHTGGNGDAGADQRLDAVHLLIGDEGQAHADDDTRQGAAHGAEGGEGLTVIGLLRYGGSHGTVGDVDGGVEHRAPQDVGHEEVGDLGPHGQACQAALVNQEGGNGHRAAHTQQPGLELAVGGGAGTVADAAHRHIGEGVHDARNGHNKADHTGRNTHDVGIELHEHHGGKYKGKVVAEVSEQVTDLVADAEGPHRGAAVHTITPYPTL